MPQALRQRAQPGLVLDIIRAGVIVRSKDIHPEALVPDRRSLVQVLVPQAAARDAGLQLNLTKAVARNVDFGQALAASLLGPCPILQVVG